MYDKITEVTKKYDEIEHVTKFNPFHDAKGRFSNKRGFATYSADPNTKAGAMAIGRSLGAGYATTENKHKNAGGKSMAMTYAYMDFENMKIANEAGVKMGQLKGKKHAQQTVQQAMQAQQAAQANPKATTTKPKQAKAKPKQDDAQQKPDNTKDQVAVNNKTQKTHKDWHKNDYTNAEIDKRVAQDLNTDTNTARKLREAVTEYSGSGYGAIRDAAKYADDPKYKPLTTAEKNNIRTAKRLEEFIQRSEKWEGSELYRGIKVEKNVAKDIIQKATNGEPMDMRGPSSWSTKKSTAESFASTALDDHVEIIFHLGGKANGTSIKHLSKFQHEDEVLLSKNARFEADIVQQVGNQWHIYGRDTSLD